MPQNQFEGKPPPAEGSDMTVGAFPTTGGEAINIGEVSVATSVPRPDHDATTESISTTSVVLPVPMGGPPPPPIDDETRARFDRIERAVSALVDRVQGMEKNKTEKPYIVAFVRAVLGALLAAFTIFVTANVMELSWKEIGGLMLAAAASYIVSRGGFEGFVDQKAADTKVEDTNSNSS